MSAEANRAIDIIRLTLYRRRRGGNMLPAEGLRGSGKPVSWACHMDIGDGCRFALPSLRHTFLTQLTEFNAVRFGEGVDG